MAGRGEQFGGGLLLAFADRPQDAPVIHFGGPLILRVSMESGALFVPINYDDKPDPTWYDKHPPQYEEKSLVRGEARHLVAQIGTPGLGRGTFAALSAGVPPAGAAPGRRHRVPAGRPEGGKRSAVGPARFPLLRHTVPGLGDGAAGRGRRAGQGVTLIPRLEGREGEPGGGRGRGGKSPSAGLERVTGARSLPRFRCRERGGDWGRGFAAPRRSVIPNPAPLRFISFQRNAFHGVWVG